MTKVLFVPGYREDRTSRDYDAVVRAIEARGHDVMFIDIDWKRSTIDDWAKILKSKYDHYDPREVILAGFSYGAMTALVVAAESTPKELWLFSLSPYFKEDIPGLKQVWLNSIGKRRTEAFTLLEFSDLAARTNCPVKLAAGELEIKKYPDIGHRFEVAKHQFRDCQAEIARGAGHAVDHPSYIRAIDKLIK